MRYVIIFTFLAAFYPNVFSQTIDSSNLKPKNSLTKGSWSVQFQVGWNLQIQAFEGLAISLKRHFSKKTAVRFGLGLGFRGTDDDVDVNAGGPYYGDTNIVQTTLNQRYYSVVITGSYLIYPNPDANINLYFGFGPRGRYSYRKDEYSYYNDGEIRSYVDKGWSAGINGVFGCEWFPVHYLSFFAEYSAYAQYIQNDGSQTQYDINRKVLQTYNDNSKGFEFVGNSAKLGLSLYF